MNGYSLWYLHGEKYPTLEIGRCSNPETGQHIDNDFGDYRRYEEMVIESMHQPEASYYQQIAHDPNLEDQNFYKILKQASEPLWDGCTKTSTLPATTRLLDWKSQSNVSDTSFDKLFSIVKDILPFGEKLPNSLYETKKMLKPLKLPLEWIDDMFDMKHNIIQTMCKLEQIYPPSFFHSMEHLVIHLADEAIIGGPVMYKTPDGSARHLEVITNKPSRHAHYYNGYLVNGYKFHTQQYSEGRVTNNFGDEERFESPLTVTRAEQLSLASTTNTYEKIIDDKNERIREEDEEVEDFEVEDDENELMSGNRRKDKDHNNNSFSGSARHRVRSASPNSTEEPHYRTTLVPIDMPIVTRGAVSNSQGAISQQTGMADPLADLAGILHRQAQETGHMP
ncbi:unnamed protein product [Lactuca saligna]|uniref:DUF4218 domain-containing protein n=1 Tax=Lactuca saligna TaxID=75948 RepID=A0AA35YLU2_LACSI|nr:unnamed protein product [Lactuca saligna]